MRKAVGDRSHHKLHLRVAEQVYGVKQVDAVAVVAIIGGEHALLKAFAI